MTKQKEQTLNHSQLSRCTKEKREDVQGEPTTSPADTPIQTAEDFLKGKGIKLNVFLDLIIEHFKKIAIKEDVTITSNIPKLMKKYSNFLNKDIFYEEDVLHALKLKEQDDKRITSAVVKSMDAGYKLALKLVEQQAKQDERARILGMIDECKRYTRKLKPFFKGDFPKYITLIEIKELTSKINKE